MPASRYHRAIDPVHPHPDPDVEQLSCIASTLYDKGGFTDCS